MGKSKVRVENSIPVQARVDVRTLGNMVLYFSNEGYIVSSISQLVSWSMDLCLEILVKAGYAKDQLTDPSDAYRYMDVMGLRQKSLIRRGMAKTITAKGFNEVRLAGGDPRFENKNRYDQIHNRETFEDMPVEVEVESEGMKGISDMSSKYYTADGKIDRSEDIKRDMERFKANAEIDENGIVQNLGEDNNRVTEDNFCKIDTKKSEVQTEMVKEIKKERVKNSDRIKPATRDEIESKAIALEKKDREYLKMLKEMNAAPKATA